MNIVCIAYNYVISLAVQCVITAKDKVGAAICECIARTVVNDERTRRFVDGYFGSAFDGEANSAVVVVDAGVCAVDEGVCGDRCRAVLCEELTVDCGDITADIERAVERNVCVIDPLVG